MIKKIKVKNFKCFSDIEFELGNVNLLAGSNGCGKSSLIHALLLLKQSVEQSRQLGDLYLYGKYVDLGTAKEVLYEDAQEDEITISIENEKADCLVFAPKYEADKYVLRVEKSDYSEIPKLEQFNIFSAISFDEALGKQGQNTISFLEEQGLKIQVDTKLCVQDTEQTYLLYQVNAWLDLLFDGFKLNISTVAESDAVSLRYQEQGEKHVSTPHRAINVGFGITYVLPVLVSIIPPRSDYGHCFWRCPLQENT